MIPPSKDIYKKIPREQVEYILLNDKTYFKTVEKFINLHERFSPESLIEKTSLWIEMIISPLITITKILFFGSTPDIFTVLTIHKTINIWLEWFDWKQLQNSVREWIKIVRSIGGPFIGCNDAKYHMYVYADGMQRIHDSLLGGRRISKERTKSF
jgi:hypothetical protein